MNLSFLSLIILQEAFFHVVQMHYHLIPGCGSILSFDGINNFTVLLIGISRTLLHCPGQDQESPAEVGIELFNHSPELGIHIWSCQSQVEFLVMLHEFCITRSEEHTS